MLSQLNTKSVEKDNNPEIGELIEVELPDVGREKFLRVRCATGRMFCLPVPPDMKTALQAKAFTFNLSEEELLKMEVET